MLAGRRPDVAGHPAKQPVGARPRSPGAPARQPAHPGTRPTRAPGPPGHPAQPGHPAHRATTAQPGHLAASGSPGGRAVRPGDDLGRRVVGVQRGHRSGAPPEHGPLVHVALVSDLPVDQRRGVGQQDEPPDLLGRARASRVCSGPAPGPPRPARLDRPLARRDRWPARRDRRPARRGEAAGAAGEAAGPAPSPAAAICAARRGPEPAESPDEPASWPVSTASCSRPPLAESSAGRSVPTRTQVPVASLKSSAIRPSKRSPAFGSTGSTKRHGVARPVEAARVERGLGQVRRPAYPGVTFGPLTRISSRSPTGASLTSTPGSARRCSRRARPRSART